MKTYLLIILLTPILVCRAQHDSLNTARNCLYMAAKEREMIYEINRLRNDPKSYLVYIMPLLKEARERLKTDGPGYKNYSVTYTGNPGETPVTDTTWHFVNEEEVRALTTLVDTLMHLNPLMILKPDKGIYEAAALYANDEQAHNWGLMHVGSDNSEPWDRIKLHSPSMSFGNENIGAITGSPSARDIVLLLLIDSGIPGYGHRYNILNAHWTHIACKQSGFKGSSWWLQEFGQRKK